MSEPAHWTVVAMADVVSRRRSAAWLREVADAVPEAHLKAFYEQLGAVVRELISRGEHVAATDVVDVLVNLKVKS